jgi:DNA-binding XRE family transcriptional regulator
MMIRPPQIIERNGKPAYALVPIDEWDRIVEMLEDVADLRACDEVLADPKHEWVPFQVVQALVEGQNPIRVWREHRGLTPEQLAERMGSDPSAITQLEEGRAELDSHLLARLAAALGLEPEDLSPTVPERGRKAD